MYFGDYGTDELNISDKDRKTLEEFWEHSDKRLNCTKEELEHMFQIAETSPGLQIEMWLRLPDEIVDNPENEEIFEKILDNKFGDYIKGINKKTLIQLLNSSRTESFVIDEKKKVVVYENVALLGQMNSYVFEDTIAKEAFSFEQLLEIVSNERAEETLELILRCPHPKELLVSIGKDSQNWQAKFQYIMDLNDFEKREFIWNFDSNENLIQDEIKRRKKRFSLMERGYIKDEDEEFGYEDCYFDPHKILVATFGISYAEAEEIVKKYGADLEKLSVETEADRRSYRKLEIIKELVTPIEFEDYVDYEDYYYSHREELLTISKEVVSPFYRVELEKEFLDLYSRQYGRALGVQANKIQNISYNGKSIPVYEAYGDFMILIRGEQNVSKENFWNSAQMQVKGLCQSTIAQDYIRPVNYSRDDVCFIGSISLADGELRMASTTNIKSRGANVALSNLGIKSDYGNGVVFRTPREQINNSRGIHNETDTSRNFFNSETGIYERKLPDYIVYIQDTNDTDVVQDPRFKTAQFVASQIGIPILVIPREKCAQREQIKIQELTDKLLGCKERSDGETDESIIKELVVKFNNNREGILASQGLRGKYFTEEEHIELVGTINARLSQLMLIDPKQYESLANTVGEIYKEEIAKYYAFSYDREDGKKELDINSTREHLKPYEDFLMERERNMFDLSADERDKIFSIIKNISQTSYYDMNKYHSLSHIQKVIMFSGILAPNENLSDEETEILLAAAAFHDSGRDGAEGENDNHALASARQVQEYFESNPNNPFGITAENISIIQAAIEYHEHMEPKKGIVDNGKLSELSCKYNIRGENIATLTRVSSLLKDADALDRARFGKKNENRWSLDARYLKSDAAKSVSMLRFSEGCNTMFSEREDQGAEKLNESIVEEIFESELNEFNRPKIQMSSIKQVTADVTASQKRNAMAFLREISLKFKKSIEEKINKSIKTEDVNR